MMNEKAVITGDIVGSTRLPANRRRDLYDIFSILSKELRRQFPQDISYDLSNFRGDGWQLIVNRPQKSLEISLFVRTYFQFKFWDVKLDTRLAIGIGKIDFIPEENISAGDGRAYTLSGHLLESLSNVRMGVAFDANNREIIQEGITTTISLLDHIVTTWNTGQSQAVFWALHRYRQSEIAGNWQPQAITQATVSHHLNAAGWEQVQSCLIYFERSVGKLLG